MKHNIQSVTRNITVKRRREGRLLSFAKFTRLNSNIKDDRQVVS